MTEDFEWESQVQLAVLREQAAALQMQIDQLQLQTETEVDKFRQQIELERKKIEKFQRQAEVFQRKVLSAPCPLAVIDRFQAKPDSFPTNAAKEFRRMAEGYLSD